jgi:hypothetical protein
MSSDDEGNFVGILFLNSFIATEKYARFSSYKNFIIRNHTLKVFESHFVDYSSDKMRS